jgi:eukaryotic-like serine/threonine-protein kinase
MEEHRLLNNRYELIELLGKGGMAVVYRARDLMLERSVSVKVLREDYSRDPAFLDRFRQEAKAAANLSHPNIVTVHDFGLDKGQLFIVMEFIPGTDLKTLIKQRGRFTADETVPLMVQACAGIGYAHRAGLVHCDVKPQNLLVTPDMRLKVTDFGIARALSTIHPEERSTVVWGSPQYFSPEQAEGAAPSPASDVYSLGVIMYEMLTGSLPFRATTAAELARQHLDAQPVPPHEMLPDISPALEQIVSKVLSKEPSQRYRTADQLGRVLMNFGNNRPSHAVQSSPDAAVAQTGENKVARTSPNSVPVPTQGPLLSPFEEIDWLSVLLGLIALVAVLGLIPFWVWVYFVYNPPVR